MNSSKKDFIEIIKIFQNNEKVIQSELEMLLRSLLEESINKKQPILLILNKIIHFFNNS